jgi:biotin-dependent carboxylase-like uncharacterized protein
VSATEIISCGPGVTVQDAGRFGFENIGITTGGAVDPLAYRTGQQLLGNPATAAALEIPLGNLSLRLTERRRVVVTGAPTPISVASGDRAMNTSFVLDADTVLSLGRIDAGMRCYIAFEGGINTPLVLGSRSTVVREGLGGLEGRALVAGDRLPLGDAFEAPCRSTVSRRYEQPNQKTGGSATAPDPAKQSPVKLRFLPGFQFDAFPADARDMLISKPYRVSARGDRMGVRLEGGDVQTGMSQLWSEGTCLGAIQIPPDGQPIVLLNDRQTMGGYPKAGAVIASDCARLAQLRPGATIQLTPISLREADRVRWLNDNYEDERAMTIVDALAGRSKNT